MSTLGLDDDRRAGGLFQLLTSLFRTYAIPEHSLVVPGPFECDDRSCFVFRVPEDWPGDDGSGSTVRLLEDGQPLGPASVSHDDIRTLGRGRYSHWGPKLYFSTSDNSDPNDNGRVYSVVPPAGWTAPPGSSCWADLQPTRERGPGQPLEVQWASLTVAPASLTHVEGPLFALPLKDDWPDDKASFSTALLLDDGEPLARAHQSAEQILAAGRDAYGHWGRQLLFATRDGSDPRRNGRPLTLAHAQAFVLSHARQPARAEEGHCWILDGLPSQWPDDQSGQSRLALLEDGHLLGPARAMHSTIREQGGGAFCHWGQQLWFSTSDGSDPNSNGRTYTVVWLDADETQEDG